MLLQAKEISNWKYDGVYSIYNLPSWEKMFKEGYSFCDDEKRKKYIGFVNENKELIGFISLRNEGDFVFFGIGIKPNISGIGIGKLITKLALIESQNIKNASC